jgi:hypothetical protein
MKPTFWRQVELLRETTRLVTFIQDSRAIAGRRVSLDGETWVVAAVFGEPVDESMIPDEMDGRRHRTNTGDVLPKR